MNYYDESMAPLMNLLEALVVLLVPVIIISIIYCCAFWKVFKKAGKAGWKSLVPFYRDWVLVEIAGLEWWWFLLILSPWILAFIGLGELGTLASSFASLNCYYNIAKKFNKDTGYAICSGLFSFIFILIFGFSRKQVYNASIPVSKNGIFGTPEGNTYGYTNNSYQSENYYNNNYQSNYVNQSTNTVDTSNANNNVQNNVNQEFSFCGNCGTKLNKDVRFCPNCGKENL